jgi:hypothetical protein
MFDAGAVAAGALVTGEAAAGAVVAGEATAGVVVGTVRVRGSP